MKKIVGLGITCLYCAALALPMPAALITGHAIGFNPANGKVYVVDESGDRVLVIAGPASAPLSVKVGPGPDALAINRLTGKVYVANASGGTVSVLDGDTNAVSATVKAGPHPYMLAVNEKSGKVYVTNTFSNLVAEIDGATNSVVMLKLGSADNLAVDAKTDRVFLIGYEDPRLRTLDGFIPAEEHMWALDVNEQTGHVYVTASGTAGLLAMEESTHREIRVPVGVIPCALSINRNTNRIYVLNYADGTVTVVDGARHVAIATVKVGDGPQALVADARNNLVFVANTHSNTVSVIDGKTNAVIGTLPAGHNPYAITLGLNPDTVYVANSGDPCFTAVSVGMK